MARFCPLFSGSSGNSTYIGTKDGGILIDAGVSARKLEKALSDRGIAPESIRAVFVTHEHIDHIRGISVFCKRYGTPVYASAGTLEAMEWNGEVIDAPMPLGDWCITPFATPHDSRESQGYVVETSDGRRLAVATDIGVMWPSIHDHLVGCDLVLLESNHDVRMLQNGPYPYITKQRILSDRGHLSNTACAAEVLSLVAAGTTRVFLAHISKENNRPSLAFETTDGRLRSAGMIPQADYLLRVAPPEATEPMMVL